MDTTMIEGKRVLVAVPPDGIEYPVGSTYRNRIGTIEELRTWQGDEPGEKYETALVGFSDGTTAYIELQHLIAEPI